MRVQSGPTAQFIGIKTTCTRNGSRTAISNRILTLDVDTYMGAGQDELATRTSRSYGMGHYSAEVRGSDPSL